MLELLKDRHRRMKAASRGARVALLNDCNGFTALFEDATMISKLTDLKPKQLGDGIFESIPVLTIPYSQMPATMAKLVGHASVAMIEMAMQDKITQMVCFYVQPMGTPARPEPLAVDDDEDLLGSLAKPAAEPSDDDLLAGL
jgi:hypothetical protein